MPRPFAQTAWNGVRFSAPGHWEVSRIAMRHLVLGDDTGPRLEAKWFPTRRRRPPAPAAVLRRHLAQRVRLDPLPAAWSAGLAGYAATAFSWRGPVLQGRGVVLTCSRCGTVSLLQFLQPREGRPDAIPARILASWRDHPRNGTTTWALFGIRVRLPADCRLHAFRFVPGRFELHFRAARRARLGLYRWAPADLLLEDTDLARLAARQLALAGPVALAPVDGPPGWQRVIRPVAGGWRAVLRRGMPWAVREAVLLRHMVADNQILGVRLRMRGNGAAAEALLEGIRHGYGIA